LLLWHRPAVGLALLAAAAVFSLPIAAGPLFLASAESATLHRQIDASCSASVGARITARTPYARLDNRAPFPIGPKLVDERLQWMSSAAPSQPRLGSVRSTLVAGNYGSQTPVHVLPRKGRGKPNVASVVLVSRDDAPANVNVLQGPQGRGLWLPDGFASSQGLAVGDRARVFTPEGAQVDLPVAAVYQDLRTEPDREFWCGFLAEYRGNPLQERPVYPFVLVDRETFDSVGVSLGLQVTQTMELPVDAAGISVPEAEQAGRFLSSFRDDVVAQRTMGAGFPYFTAYQTLLPRQVGRAQLARAALTVTVRPMAVAGALTGLLLVAASASYWVDRRRREIDVLAAHGVGPGALAAKAVLEAAAALLPGAALGWLGARGLIATIGPSAIAPGALQALVLSLCAAGLALLVVGLVAVVRTREGDVPHHRRGRVARLPWEIAALIGAALGWRLIKGTTSTAMTDVGSVAHVDPRLLVVPMLLVAAAAGLAARLVRWRLRRAGRGRGASAAAPFLAGRRIASAPGAAALLIAVTAVPVALSTYGATVTGSTEHTLRAEARTIVGSDVVFQLTEPVDVPPHLADDATVVLRYNGVTMGTKQVDLLGVDPQAWADVSESGAAPLADLAGELFAGRPTVVVASRAPVGSAEIILAEGQTSEQHIPVTVAASVAALPAEHGGYSVVVMHRDVLTELTSKARPELWMQGDEDAAIRAVADAGLPVARYVQASTVHADGVYEPVTYTFQFLTALAVLTGAIAALGLVLHLEARSRARRSAYVMLRRMGLRARTHLRALLAELGVLLGGGVVVGLGLAALSVALTRDHYDLAGTVPPGTLLVIPWPTVVGVIAAVTIVALLAAAAAQSSVSRAHPAEVLRDTR
jgi:putative ABC transport system permease protein